MAQVPAADLKVGDEVVVNGAPTKLTFVDSVLGEVTVLKIVFSPDRPVAVFHLPECIHSHGDKQKKIRRGRYSHPAKEVAESVPATETEYKD